MRVPRRRFRITEKMIHSFGRRLGVMPEQARQVLGEVFAEWLGDQPVYSLDVPELIIELPADVLLRLKDYVLSLAHPGVRTNRLVTREKVAVEALDEWLKEKGF